MQFPEIRISMSLHLFILILYSLTSLSNQQQQPNSETNLSVTLTEPNAAITREYTHLCKYRRLTTEAPIRCNCREIRRRMKNRRKSLSYVKNGRRQQPVDDRNTASTTDTNQIRNQQPNLETISNRNQMNTGNSIKRQRAGNSGKKYNRNDIYLECRGKKRALCNIACASGNNADIVHIPYGLLNPSKMITSPTMPNFENRFGETTTLMPTRMRTRRPRPPLIHNSKKDSNLEYPFPSENGANRPNIISSHNSLRPKIEAAVPLSLDEADFGMTEMKPVTDSPLVRVGTTARDFTTTPKMISGFTTTINPRMIWGSVEEKKRSTSSDLISGQCTDSIINCCVVGMDANLPCFKNFGCEGPFWDGNPCSIDMISDAIKRKQNTRR